MASSRICIFFRETPADRWLKGDHRWRAKVRRLVRGPDPIGGIKSVYVNLCKGLDRIGADYAANIPYSEIRPGDLVGVIGLGTDCLDGYEAKNPILAGVAVCAHSLEWPTLFEDYPVASYVVHCDWVKAMYERHYGPRISTWAVGIDTDHWAPASTSRKSVDFLVYDKVRWDHDRVHRAMVDPILAQLRKRGLTYEVIRYGSYKPRDYASALARSKAMLFLCEHETQGLAYQQAMSCNVPILAWNPGAWLDPWRFRYGEGHVPATSVPFFDERCGVEFLGIPDFEAALERFLECARSGKFSPRDYVMENLTLERSAQKYIALLEAVAE
ncbi:glycosyltransferase family 1 protein [Methylocystis sp. WRRC1]|uniref:glycosyltransferase n=1 Tax=Methylocystis sp. WRRC1 TaxID=1732014 RepID=UPI001D15A67E|nr:glycosyltransferase family 1 protein [Methylocystis sp. WRRC1]MCC3244466.1 glycosyltransferase family 1 protein [Methylocystis sp. WRRC1]